MTSNKCQQSSLQKKLKLLSYIRQGNIQQIEKFTQELSKNAKTNPQIYERFSKFVTEHKEGLIKMEEDQKESNYQEVQIINVENQNIDDKQWDSDASIDLSQDSDCSQNQQKQKKLFKQVQNIKPLLKQKKNTVTQQCSSSKQKTLNPKIDSSKAKKQTVANPGKVSSVSLNQNNGFVKKQTAVSNKN